MTTPSDQSPPDLGVLLARGVRALREATELPVAFGGAVSADRRRFVIDQLSGTATRSLLNLTVSSGAGLGGKVLALARPSAVADYLTAEEITHRYDAAVAPEGLRAMLALPIRVGDGTHAVLYAAGRQRTHFGDDVLRAAERVVRRVERDIAVEQEVLRRLARMTAPATEPRTALSPGEADELCTELLAIAATIEDEGTRGRLLEVCRRVKAHDGRYRHGTRPALSPRETEVLALVATGCTNDAVARRLGLLPNTVKSYLKSAMKKLDATNRVQAVNRARQAGLIG
ncbi:GAF domain-containing protein [Saccharopolyspora erythraea NRRL 2338]|uniref:Transcriptional regulator n=2 Tax=Saccharopolyspora erythraea TaxID=1836 RepID=A4FE56_SACEN|nr:LuxR C-terminal-related transcriptional regulator [Saccharopolyspora erythraea]EQD82019.1 LuxR family transcriptional regulator [Saccharopolyspora erythraea D]PFG96058.1 GAF domain-containing protein [Saccharopolyspora erythraea NRRL 2338]QRK92604.1 GAF domain-containing protein [Saccharopolyspora erythraea]CAM02331.1 putative transcriptional regulator [Saccharopolyspora erythraea NRRL 2338]